uniref:NADH-ubiquinone oxidoreductase chain 2 n=1 Tax=Danionella dracula TaxID=623740 RepID=A0A1Q2TBC0_9TELE|nr:NADH dehydrogenase subunit 2 [Danionella dracula]
MTPYTLFITLFSLGVGTTMTFASTHWMLAWMGLETSTLAIIPMMAQQHSPRTTEATTKYFLIQATSAAMILYASMMTALNLTQWDIIQPTSELYSTITILALAMKTGMAPLHFWLPEVLQGIDVTTGLILSTWQKLAPMALFVQVTQTANPLLLTLLGITSSVVGGWSGLNQTQLRKVMAYSSIAHMGWMVIIMQYTPNLTILALALYIFMTSAAFLTMKIMNTTQINTLLLMNMKSPVTMAMMVLAMLSLGGLPPLTGFMSKWLILEQLTKQDIPVTATVMALSALLSLYFYLRLCHTMALTTSPNTMNSNTHWRTQIKKGSLPLVIAMTMSIGLLPITPTILSLTL